MSRTNLYIYFDSVTNHILSRAIDLQLADFNKLPRNLILGDSSVDFGRYDVQTDFKILRGEAEVSDYLQAICKGEVRIADWIDFESIELMHRLTPNEVAELLYLFHAKSPLRSAFFYKLQNEFVYLTQPNGLNRMYYRHSNDFLPRFQRVMQLEMEGIVNESRPFFFSAKQGVNRLSMDLAEKVSPLFTSGLKVGFSQAYLERNYWKVPLFEIEDELTKLSRDQSLNETVGCFIYDLTAQRWRLELKEVL